MLRNARVALMVNIYPEIHVYLAILSVQNVLDHLIVSVVNVLKEISSLLQHVLSVLIIVQNVKLQQIIVQNVKG